MTGGSLSFESFTWDSNPRALGKALVARCNPRRPAPQRRPVPVPAGAKGLSIPGVARGAQAFGGAAGAKQAGLFRRGDRVRHSRFGEGTVLMLFDGDKRMTIRFDDGTEKTFAAELAPVVRIEGKAE